MNADDVSIQDEGTGAIDIPTSPRPYHPNYRRSSSVAQQHRPLPLDDDLGDILPFGMRSASMGDGEERPPLSLSALLGLQEGSDVAVPPVSHHERAFGPAPRPSDDSVCMGGQCSSSQEGREEERPSSSRGTSYRPRIGRGSGRGHTPSVGSTSSLTGEKGGGSASSDQRGNRYSFTRPGSTFEDDEPLLFAMSDFGVVQQSRRSVEEARGGSTAGAGGDRAGGGRRGGHMWG